MRAFTTLSTVFIAMAAMAAAAPIANPEPGLWDNLQDLADGFRDGITEAGKKAAADATLDLAADTLATALIVSVHIAPPESRLFAYREIF